MENSKNVFINIQCISKKFKETFKDEVNTHEDEQFYNKNHFEL